VLAPAIYARVSSPDQDCSPQLRECREWVTRMGWPKATEYVDHGVSGVKASRPAFDRLMRASANGRHDCVIVTKIDRFGRSVLNFTQSIAALDRAGVRFLAINQGIDTDASNPMSRLMLAMLAAIAEFERELILERSTAGRMRKFADGQPDSWNLVYGFEKGRPVVKESKAEVMRQVFAWRDAEYSLYEIEGMVTALGAEPPRGERWWPGTISKLLQNRQFVGEYERCGKIWELPRIIDQDVFDRVQAKMQEVMRRGLGNAKTKYELTGILRSWCGRPMSGVRDHDLLYYRCAGAQRRDKGQSFKRCAC
jgi:DNA invertase Pin-like site-specific DNA recombinase